MNGSVEPNKPKRVRTRRGQRGIQRTRERVLRRKGDDGNTFLSHLSDGWKERDDRTIHIGRLPAAVRRKEDVAEAFVEFGSITHIHIQPDLKFGFVHFEEERSATEALKRKSVEVLGGRVDIRTALNRRTRSPHSDLGHDAPEAADLLADEPDDASEGCPSEAAGQDSEAYAGAPLPSESDPLLEFWSERSALPGTDSHTAGDGGALESREILEERLQALRVACIHTLDTHSGQMMLNELGQEELIMEQKCSLPRISLLKVIQAFVENFQADDKGNGQYLVTLMSSDDSDTSKIEELATELSRGRHGGKEQPKGKPVDARKATVVAGLLSDGWKERDERTVYVGRLPDAVKTKDDVLSVFAQFGPVTHIHIRSDLQFGFVHFEDVGSAAAAIGARFVDVCGSSVEVRTASRLGPAGKRRGSDNPTSQGAFPARGDSSEQRTPRGGPRWGMDPPRSREPPPMALRGQSRDRSRRRGEVPAGHWKGRSKCSARELEPDVDPFPPSRLPPRPPSRQFDGPRPPSAPPHQEAKKVFYPKAVDLQSTHRVPLTAGAPPKPSMAPHLEELHAGKLAKPASVQSLPSKSALPRMALPMPSSSTASKPAQDKRVPLPLPLPAKAPLPRPASEAATDGRGRKRGRSPA